MNQTAMVALANASSNRKVTSCKVCDGSKQIQQVKKGERNTVPRNMLI